MSEIVKFKKVDNEDVYLTVVYDLDYIRIAACDKKGNIRDYGYILTLNNLSKKFIRVCNTSPSIGLTRDSMKRIIVSSYWIERSSYAKHRKI